MKTITKTMTKTMDINLSVKELTLIGMMVAIIEVCKVVLLPLPNIELTSFWVMMFTLYFGARIIYVIPVFILIEGAMYGFGIWWIMYLYVWPLLALLAWLFRKSESAWTWSAISGIFGLSYGMLCSIPYYIIGAAEGGLAGGLQAGFAWWISGIPLDIVHGVGNFSLMLVLYRPIRSIMGVTKKMFLGI